MKLSKARRAVIYQVIRNEVTDLRISLNTDGLHKKHDVAIAQTGRPIFNAVLKALNVQDEARKDGG